ncbi:MAG: FtsX-like permease family protein [Peptococcaceae bacterium]|nr:FtsX-like permease family protein [Peptococcaceae bacterium]
MNIVESIRIALKAIWANKVRSFLTMLGIIIGVGAVIIMVAIGNGASKNIAEQIQGLGSNLLTVYPGYFLYEGDGVGVMRSAPTLSLEDAAALEQGEHIQAVAPMVNTYEEVFLGSGNTQTSIYGTTASYLKVRNKELQWGRFFTDQEVADYKRVAVVGSGVVESIMGSMDPGIIGKNIKIRNVPFQVIGVLQGSSTGFYFEDNTVLIPITAAQLRLTGSKEVQEINVQAVSADDMQSAQEEIISLLRKAHKLGPGQENDFEISNQEDILKAMEEATRTMTMLLGGIAAISLLVGGIGIMNIMLVSVTERTREIGIRKAVGAKESNILWQFLIEAVILSVIGGGVGILFGWGGSALASRFLGFPAVVTLSSVVLAVTFSALIGIVFGVFPARKASVLNPIESLRYE